MDPRVLTERVLRKLSAVWRVPEALERVDRGYTPSFRALAFFKDGSSAFVKAADTEPAISWLRHELVVYEHLADAPFLVAPLAGHNGIGDELPLLVLPNLSNRRWPPPWDGRAVESVLAALSEIASTPASWLPTADIYREQLDGWPRVAVDASPFLHLGFASEAWLKEAAGILIESSAGVSLEGTTLVHMDVRSDNLCIDVSGRLTFVDWSHACAGPSALDAVGWAPSLHAEGGPAPWQLLPNADPGMVALIAGYFAANAGLAPIPGAPGVRQVQAAQLATALPWAARVNGLRPPDASIERR